MTTFVDKKVTKKICGIPVSWGNVTEIEIILERDGTAGLVSAGGSYTMIQENGYFVDHIDIDYDFDMVETAHFVYTVANILGSLGGVVAIFN